MLARTARQASGRGIVLLPAAALIVHQLRYWLTYGSQASNQLADTGHAYLAGAVPWVVMLAAAGAGMFAVRRNVVRRSLRQRWAGATATLMVLFVVQEALEGLLAGGHPGGFSGIFGHGGWWSIPVAVAVGLALALLLRVADAFARRDLAPPVSRGATLSFFPVAVAPLRVRPLATAAAGRAPPRPSPR